MLPALEPGVVLPGKTFDELGWDSLNNRRIMRKLSLLHEIYYYKFPSYLDDILTPLRPTSRRQLALPDEKTKLKIFPIGTEYFQKNFLSFYNKGLEQA